MQIIDNPLTVVAAADSKTARARAAAQLEEVVRRARAGEFTSQTDIADAYQVDQGTVSRWKDRALIRGLITSKEWEQALLKGKLARLEHE